jgi:hypothetical protein
MISLFSKDSLDLHSTIRRVLPGDRAVNIPSQQYIRKGVFFAVRAVSKKSGLKPQMGALFQDRLAD